MSSPVIQICSKNSETTELKLTLTGMRLQKCFSSQGSIYYTDVPIIENERMKQFSRMRELDKVYRGLFRTLSKIRCDENVFAEIVND